MLIDRGYKRYRINPKKGVFEPADVYQLASAVNLDHRYIHKTDKVILEKIKQGKSIVDDDFTWEDRKNVICFGLREKGRPPTLISPRPKIRVRRLREFNGEKGEIIEDETYDNSMNIVLSKEKPEQVFKALFDDSIVFKYDLR